MNREQFIEKLLAIYRLKYKPSDLEVEELKLMLEMMPDRPVLILPKDKDNQTSFPINPLSPNQVVMYGAPYPGYQTISDTPKNDNVL